MARRSPWARQPRKTKQALSKKYSANVLPNQVVELSAHFAKGRSAVKAEHVKFLERNKNDLIKTLSSQTKKRVSKEAFDGKVKLDALHKDLILELTQDVMKSIHDKRKPQSTKSIKKAITEYAQARQLPQDKALIEKMSNELYTQTIRTGKPTINLLHFEKNYLKQMKAQRKIGLALNTEANKIIKKSLGAQRLTTNQKQQLRRHFNKKFSEFKNKLATEIISKNKKTNSTQLYNQFLVETSRELKQIHSGWLTQEKTLKSNNKLRMEALTKGNRNERKQQYELEKRKQQEIMEKKQINESRKKMIETEKRIIDSGKKFNATNYCLNEIKKEHATTGQAFQELFDKKMLSTHSIRRLFDSGTLSRRIFVQAVNNGFVKEFGAKEINSLASGIAHIGPKVPKNEHAIRSFQSPNATKIFNFLKKNNLIETHHRNGACVMLRRPQTKI